MIAAMKISRRPGTPRVVACGPIPVRYHTYTASKEAFDSVFGGNH